MTPPLRIVLLAAVSLAAACKDEDPASPATGPDAGPFAGRKLGCDDADLLIGATLAADPSLVALRRCGTDADCTAHASPQFVCDDAPQVRLTSCDLPIGAGNLDASVQFVSALERVLCSRIARPCVGGASCAPARPRCVDGECKMVSTHADAGI